MQIVLDVLYEDNHLLVVNKPAMLPTMGVKPGQASLLTIAKEYVRHKYNKPGNVYLGVVSRLDAFVSGIVVFARTSKSATRLNQQFANSLARKKYWAIVPSTCDEAAELENWIAKDETNHRMMTVSEHADGKPKRALLRYKRIGEFEDLSLLEIDLITGRKHQIRVQLSAAGYPVIGDKKYGSQQKFKSGIALHSRQLAFEHPTKKQMLSFSKEPPIWWKLNRFHDR